MNHSESEMCALNSSIEFVKPDNEFERSISDLSNSPEGEQTVRFRKSNNSRRRITILSQEEDYSGVFDRAHDVIAVMQNAYEKMFLNWKLESDLNSEMEKEIQKVLLALDVQKKITKQLLDQKSGLQEELERSERKPRLQNKVEDLEAEVKGLKNEIGDLKTEVELKNTQLEKNRILKFYREELSVSSKEKVAQKPDTYRARSIPIRRVHSQPEERRVKPLNNKLLSFFGENNRH